MESTRRAFLEQVGQGVLLAGVGSAVTCELGLAPALAAEGPARLTFGKREWLVDLLQQTPPAKLLPLVVDRLRKGTELKELVAAAALANARNFGGEDYVGFHTLMALAPAYSMARELPAAGQALPVLKVLYRNSARIEARGGKEVLTPVAPARAAGKPGGGALREAVHRRDLAAAEREFAALAAAPAADAFNDLLATVEDEADVHRVVLAYRSWDMLDLLGKDHAHTMLRQSVHYCVQAEAHHRPGPDHPRVVLPKLLEKHRLLGKSAGKRKLDDAELTRLWQGIFKATPADAAGLVAEALADGIAPEALGEAVSLASCELVLRDRGRTAGQAQPGKPLGSVHGDSVGVHACDSVNAWRNIAAVSNWRNTAACLILAGLQTARDRARGGDFLRWEPYPLKKHRDTVKGREAAPLLREIEAAVRANDQGAAAAAVARYLELGHPDRDAFALLLRYAVSQDGALHAEKFYRTAREEYGRTRPACRGRFLVALARVTASAFGYPAPGYVEACKLLDV